MNAFFSDTPPQTALLSDAIAYSIDTWQRSLIYLDVLRRRGNTYIEHLRSGQPPVLSFHYEMILDGQTFARPVNYALVRISDRRGKPAERSGEAERRAALRKPADFPKRPIVIIDPRAGHGPGIGGSKRDSEIGMALDNGHPVYFILFYTEPKPGQTLEDVEQAEVQFIEEVVARHPNADRPAIMGNCQAGWAAALLCADRPDITGPLVLNGAPLSYWSGVGGVNPMRYRGGLAGGIWMTSLLCDLGCGKFDGANLVANFESLNPANTHWTKDYHLYSNIDTEAERYLAFEKWWGGFFMMTDQEIHYIVRNLFVGNKLEKGELELHGGQKISLKNIQSPILVFASRGDNITPPQQALNWITRVYQSVDEIKEKGQIIIYMIHEDIGHLGIFVSASIAKKEHKEIISNFDMIGYLPPGLYEMVIEGNIKTNDFNVRFEERKLADIEAMSGGAEEEEDFSVVSAVSEVNDTLYGTLLRPWVKMCATDLSAEIMRWLHPLRAQRYMFSDMNPMLRPLKSLATQAMAGRRPAAPENFFTVMEKNISAGVVDTLNLYRDSRDQLQEQVFRWTYGNDLLRFFFFSNGDGNGTGEEKPAAAAPQAEERTQQPAAAGRTAEGLIRCMMAMARSSRNIGRRHYTIAENIARTHKTLKRIKPAEFRRIANEQARSLQIDGDKAFSDLADMIPNIEDRREALDFARRIALVDGSYEEAEKVTLEKIGKALGLEMKKPVVSVVGKGAVQQA